MTDGPRGSDKVPRARRRVGWRVVAGLLLVAVLLVVAQLVPLDAVTAEVRRRVGELGAAGPVAFGLIYVLAALLFVPGSPMTIAAGALFGLVEGTVVVWTAATLAAALAFLIARGLARERVARWARKQPGFRAIDRAIEDGGWRMIALLRLVPAYPFSLGNYLFGLTAVRFWPYLIASWLCMLPGTVLFVYVGVLGLRSLDAANAEVRGWWYALLGVGFVALLGAVAYGKRLATRRLRQMGIDEECR